MTRDVVLGLHREETPDGGVVKLEKWPEGYVLWYHGKIVFRSWIETAEFAAQNPAHFDNKAVTNFAYAMRIKLASKRLQGRGGWQDKEHCSNEYLSRLLREHVEKGDPVDVANFCMMIDQRRESIAPQTNDGPTYLDFITPDEVFDKGPAAVKEWQKSKSAELTPCNQSSQDVVGTRLVIVESPFSGEVEANITYARAALHDCLSRGEAPYASHLLYTQPGVLDDNNVDERRRGIEAGLAWGTLASATVVYTDRGISTGMQQGIDRAVAEGRIVEYRSIGEVAAQ